MNQNSHHTPTTNNTPTFVDISVNNNANNENESPSLRSCFRSNSIASSCSEVERRRVRLEEQGPIVHLPPAQLVETLQNAEDRRSIWYNGNDIRRMKQAAVKVIAQLDANQIVPQAVETDWLSGTTSVRGLEFGTRVGQERKRSTRQFQRVVLQEQERLRLQEEELLGDAATTALATTAQEASQASTQLAQELAIQDAAFVCDYVENVPGVTSTAASSQSRRRRLLVQWVRRWVRAARKAVQQQQTHKNNHNKMFCEDGRPRCDTESTFTIMVSSS
uniref:Uncharacterized protein n=1 Tax=Amphora coffeiformis TaxID=265554 RepID=A0A7S3PCX4_9STRA|eukprot:scaffold2968_cov172-Amphora_coffeaeformis.AAC.4